MFNTHFSTSGSKDRYNPTASARHSSKAEPSVVNLLSYVSPSVYQVSISLPETEKKINTLFSPVLTCVLKHLKKTLVHLWRLQKQNL